MAGTVQVLTLAEFIADMERKAALAASASYRQPLQSCRQVIVSDVKENFAAGHGPDGTPWKPLAHPRASSRGADQPLKDTGLLAASVMSANSPHHVEELTDDYFLMGTNLDRARLHQEGGTITPKNAKALSIPLTKEAARAGGARNFPRDLFVWQGDGGQAFLAEAQQKGRGKKGFTQILFQYILLDSVTIPARPFLGFGQRLVGKLVEVFKDYWGRLLGGGGKGGR